MTKRSSLTATILYLAQHIYLSNLINALLHFVSIYCQIYPLSGPVEGGTRVTIEGSNLGISVDEIKDKIAIGGVLCVPLEYSVSVK